MGRFLALLCMVTAICGASLAHAAELIMFERSGCPYCMRWDEEIAPAYQRSEEAKVAPLRRYDIGKGQPKDVQLAVAVRFTPTFVLFDQGKEIGRITGYFDNAMFWGLLGKLLEQLHERKKTG
jgi:thioredoxin-related protein